MAASAIQLDPIFGGILPGSNSKSTPRFLTPDFGKIGQAFGGLQQGITTNTPQNQAVQEQLGLRGRLGNLLDQAGQGRAAAINEGFNTAANNATGALASRGFAGSSLNIPAQLGVERERQLALGNLSDQLTQQRINSDTGISKNISDLLFGSANQATSLLGSLLSSGGIGNDATSNSTGSGSSGSVRSGSSSSDPFASSPGYFDRAINGGYSEGGSIGGGPGGGPGGPGGSPQLIQNPFTATGPGDAPGSGFEQLPVPPVRNGPNFAEDMAKAEEIVKENAKRADAYQKFVLSGGLNDPGGQLAGGPGDALGGGFNSFQGGPAGLTNLV